MCLANLVSCELGVLRTWCLANLVSCELDAGPPQIPVFMDQGDSLAGSVQPRLNWKGFLS